MLSTKVVGLPPGPRYGSISASVVSPIRRVPLPSCTSEDDRRPLDLDDLPDQCGQIRDGPALLAGEHAEERCLLLLAGALVDIELSPPVALQRIARDEYVNRKC